MSEQVAQKQEFRGEHLLPTHEMSEKAAHDNQELQEAAEHGKAEHAELLDKAHETLQEVSTIEENPVKALEASENAAAQAAQPLNVNAELKNITLRRELKTIQRKHKLPNRLLSKTIHQPVIRIASEAAGKTIARPSGILGGGLMAFVGSAVYLFLTKYIGLPYNYSLFFLMIVAGFVLGLLIELAVWTATHNRNTD